MLDPIQIRKQIDDAVGQRDVLKRQREQIDTAIRTLESYITVSEQMLRLAKGSIEHTSASVRANEEPKRQGPRTRPDSLRNQILKTLEEFQPNGVTVNTLWEKAAFAGFRTKSADPIDAVKFALFDLRKHGAPIERIGDNLWRFAGAGQSPQSKPESLFPRAD